MTNMGKYRRQIERAVTMSYMRVLSRFPAFKTAENRVMQAYIDFVTKKRENRWRDRAVPDFIIVGGMKCGTSSLFNYLNQHPRLFGSCYKELRYFSHDEYYSKGEKWYRSHFPIVKKLPGGSLTFEASPDYLASPETPERMQKLIPDVKIIALLRNPTERAISHYFHSIKKGWRQDEILNAMKVEDIIFKQRGLYKKQLQGYYNLFPAENIRVIGSEIFFENPVDTLKEVYSFLGVDPDIKISDLSPRQVGFNREPVDTAVHEYLDNYYKTFNQELFDFIGRDFGWHV